MDTELWEIENNPSKICFAGDWHANTYWAKQMIAAARDLGADTIVQVGDFGFNFTRDFLHGLRYALEEHKVNLYFVDGNHDDLGKVYRTFELDEAGFYIPKVGNYRERFHYIPRGHRWKWWDLTFMGLGGAHSVDRPWREPGISWWQTELITEADVHRATSSDDPVDVMITHDLFDNAWFPSDRKNTGWPPEELYLSQRNRLAVQAVVDHVKPKVFIHGHYHVRYERDNDGIRTIGLGMDGTSTFNNLWVVDKNELLGIQDDGPISVGTV